MMSGMNKQRGFTLIELLVVIAIIGILASVVLASLNGARKKGRDARRIADIKQIQLALEMWYDANGSEYPDALSSLAPTYISTVPTDPQGLGAYQYDNLTGTSPSAACATAGQVCSNYVLGTAVGALEDSNNAALNQSIHGIPDGSSFSCASPIYCVQP